MKMIIFEAATLQEICTKFNASPEAGTIVDIVEYGITREAGNIEFVLFYK